MGNWINPFQWINPFHIHYKGEDANTIYESFMRSNGVLLEYLPMLEDKVLGCWCKTGCHGEVIIKLYNEYVTYNEDSKLNRISCWAEVTREVCRFRGEKILETKDLLLGRGYK